MSTLYHGGIGGLWAGGTILPDQAHRRYRNDCPCCEAQKRGDATLDPATPNGWVYATTDRRYARYYASRAGNGSLYKVRLEGGIERSTEDPFPTWRARSATVIGVPERGITLTMRERKTLFLRWGGTPQEFDLMIKGVMKQHTARADGAPGS